jgi:hydroxyethylthiazole kinase-like uncharacterized protein yjeF
MSRSRRAEAAPVVARRVDGELLRSMPIPAVDGGATKAHRGTALVVGGSLETPGGALLAATAALRVGAGKVQVATVAGVAPALGVALPEARVIGVRETSRGAIDPRDVDRLDGLLAKADAVLVGTSTLDADATGELLAAVVGRIGPQTLLVIDAGAIPTLADRRECLADVAPRAAVIPNPSEMARLLDADEDDVCGDPAAALSNAVALLGTVVALRDVETRTAAPGTDHFVDGTGHAALGTSGSGDVLAGALLGLTARGCDPLRATLWAVHAHGLAGRRLGVEGPGLGTLARELPAELPAALRMIQPDGMGARA